MGADVILDPNDIDKSFATGRNFAHEALEHRTVPARPRGNRRHSRRLAIDRSTASLTARRPVDSRAPRRGDRTNATRALGPLRPTQPHDSPDERVWRDIERYAGLRLNEYAEAARRFVWNELADWYLESLKARLDAPGDDREVARAVLVHAFDSALRLLHPIVPFVTESLWQRLPGREPGRSCELLADAPSADARDDGDRLIDDPTVRRGVRAGARSGARGAADSRRQQRAARKVGRRADSCRRRVTPTPARRFERERRHARPAARAPTCASSDGAAVSAAAHAVITGGAGDHRPARRTDRRRRRSAPRFAPRWPSSKSRSRRGEDGLKNHEVRRACAGAGGRERSRDSRGDEAEARSTRRTRCARCAAADRCSLPRRGVACASAGAPPGGPEDHTPPEIVSITPDSGSVNVKAEGQSQFQFDEVVSDRPAGRGRLDRAVSDLAAQRRIAKCRWHRSAHHACSPRSGFRDNTAYRRHDAARARRSARQRTQGRRDDRLLDRPDDSRGSASSASCSIGRRSASCTARTSRRSALRTRARLRRRDRYHRPFRVRAASTRHVPRSCADRSELEPTDRPQREVGFDDGAP